MFGFNKLGSVNGTVLKGRTRDRNINWDSRNQNNKKNLFPEQEKAVRQSGKQNSIKLI